MTKRDIATLKRAVEIVGKAYADEESYDEALVAGVRPDTTRANLEVIVSLEESKASK